MPSLTLSWRRSLSYRNQSIDLLCKSMDYFLYDNGLGHENVNWSDVIIIIISIKTHMYILVSLSYVARNTVSKIHDVKKWPQCFENINTIQSLTLKFDNKFDNNVSNLIIKVRMSNRCLLTWLFLPAKNLLKVKQLEQVKEIINVSK